MSIGYACLTIGVPNADQKSCMARNASESRLLELIAYNLDSLEKIIDYNCNNNIRLFRISSDVIPFGSSTVNNLCWWDIFATKLSDIGKKIQNSGMRVSMHPGQYTVMNSPNEEVVKRAIKDLKYHNRLLDSLDLGEMHKIILHIGGVYKDKNLATNRFIENFDKLETSVKKRIVVENDDKSFNICDVLEISKTLNIPVVFDNLHNEINPCNKTKSNSYWIKECRKTWKEADGCQKIHYAQQNQLKRPGSHSQSIKINKFIDFYEKLEDKEIDIMLEVKDKNLSAVKCVNCTSIEKKIKSLELEWSKYKYKILENSPQDYLKVRELLKNKENYPVKLFYELIEDALQKENTIGNSINAAMHIWGYFKEIASDNEKNKFHKSIEDYKQNKITIGSIKNNLWKLAVKYNQTYLLDSYYFVI
jgi:UV DNA damage endonuclease